MSIALAKLSSPEILSQIREVSGVSPHVQPKTVSQEGSGQAFIDLLRDGLKGVDAQQKESDRKTVDIASGKSGDLHEAMLAATQAELTFNLMVQIRNKALEAYQEIMRMPV